MCTSIPLHISVNLVSLMMCNTEACLLSVITDWQSNWAVHVKHRIRGQIERRQLLSVKMTKCMKSFISLIYQHTSVSNQNIGLSLYICLGLFCLSNHTYVGSYCMTYFLKAKAVISIQKSFLCWKTFFFIVAMALFNILYAAVDATPSLLIY